MHILIRSAAFAAMLISSACATRSPETMQTAFDPVAVVGEVAVDEADYQIGANDLLTVTVFQIEDLDREVRVNNAGQVSLPLVGSIQAAGRTVDQLEADLAARYGARYLQNPQVTVFVKEYASQRVTVGGAVKKPGIFPVTSRLTLMQALSLAEGVTDVSNLRNVLVFRNESGERRFARFDLKAIQAGELADPQIMADDVVVVDTSTGKIALQNLIKLAPFVAVWRAYR